MVPSAPEPGPIVLAFGGNALLPDPFQPEGQGRRAADLAQAVLMLTERSPGLVLVHGNGPQVGMILLRVEATREELPPDSLDMLVAETQGSIGFLLLLALRNALRRAGSRIPATAVMTQVVVDQADPAFEHPQKPIGPAYSAELARRHRVERGWTLVEAEAGKWRRVVPSPRPLRILELGVIAEAARRGAVVIAGGGGGVPVVADKERGLIGAEAVIDKDRTAALLALQLDARAFVVLTGVPHVYRDFGLPTEERIASLSVAETRAGLEAGLFPAGSMGPKLEAACDYVEATGREALITDSASLAHALAGTAGTRIVP